MKSSRMVGNGRMNKWLNFGGDRGHRLDTGIVFRIRHYREIRKMVNGHKSAHTDSPDGGTGKTCLGGRMHCPSASSSFIHSFIHPSITHPSIHPSIHSFIIPAGYRRGNSRYLE